MVDYQNAFNAEEEVFKILKRSKRLSKYKLVLHRDDQYGIDIESTAEGYEDLAIEIESSQVSTWSDTDPYPINWKKGFSVPTRKRKFYDRHPMSLFVKVNRNITRAVIIPMVYVCASKQEGYRNQTEGSFNCNEFYVIHDPEHPALCFCPIDKLATVIDEQFKHMYQTKSINAKYTDKRPTFGPKKNKE